MAGNKMTIGKVEVYGIADTVRYVERALDKLFPADRPIDWDEQIRRYPETFGEGPTWREDFGCYLLRSQGQTVLVDTGVGPPESPFARTVGFNGELLQKLEREGVRPEDINIVIFTHLHPDHVGWNTLERDGERVPTFPKARYIAHRADWDWVNSSEERSRRRFPFVEEMLTPLETLGVLELVDGERALTSELTAIHTPGHTLGHMSIMVASNGEYAVVLGDVAAHPVQIDDAEVDFFFDVDKKTARQTRHQLYERIEAEGVKIAASHFPEPGFGEIVHLEGKRRYRALK